MRSVNLWVCSNVRMHKSNIYSGREAQRHKRREEEGWKIARVDGWMGVAVQRVCVCVCRKEGVKQRQMSLTAFGGTQT